MYVRIVSMLVASSVALAVGPSAPAQQGRSPKAARELEEALSGRVASEPVACIRESARMRVIDDSTILFRDRGVVYLQQPRAACRGLSKGMSLIRNSTGSTRMCSGDISSIVEMTSGYGSDTCIYGDFIPYKKAD
jgi:hypothetical protein